MRIDEALQPEAGSASPPGWWGEITDLVWGFGDRSRAAPARTLCLERQVHGNTVVDADEFETIPLAGGSRILRVEADGAVARAPGVVVGVRTADCVPILMVARTQRWAAAVHAGWKGTLAGIAGEAVASARRAGIPAVELSAALGPSIGPCCYAVSRDLADRFRAAGLTDGGECGATDQPHLDLRAANRRLLEAQGMTPSAIAEIGPCTRCRRDLFFSYRADPDDPGRQVSWIGWEARRPSADLSPNR